MLTLAEELWLLIDRITTLHYNKYSCCFENLVYRFCNGFSHNVKTAAGQSLLPAVNATFLGRIIEQLVLETCVIISIRPI